MTSGPPPGHPLWSVGFRPFFLAAAVFAILNMAIWLAVYRLGLSLALEGWTPTQWHAHEMIYGFSMAVIAGFLLTAAQNWTGFNTLRGRALAALWLLWLAARVLVTAGATGFLWSAIADVAFALGLFLSIAHPVIKARQLRQAPVLLILAMLAAGNALFYAGILLERQDWVTVGLYGGLYLVLGLVLYMGRRVVPFFTQRGVGHDVQLKNARWNDVASWVLFVTFLAAETLFPNSLAGTAAAGVLFVLNSHRLAGWYSAAIWRRPLLWSLHLAYAAITIGFLARVLQGMGLITPLMVAHVFALGGIGLVTLSMMTRVSLGHTGRSVHEAPAAAAVFLLIMLLALLFRVPAALANPAQYSLWVSLAGMAWLFAFVLFISVIGPMLLQHRVDANPIR